MFNIINQVKSVLGVKGTGYKVDIPDVRDVLFVNKFGATTNLPNKVDLMPKSLVIKDQLATSSCVGQSIANALRIAYIQDGKPAPDLSALFVYYNSRFDHQSPVIDDGTFVRTAIKNVMKFGVCEEQKWSFAVSKANTRPDHLAYRNGISQRGLRGYYRIESGDLNSVKKALATGKPVVAGWDIDDYFAPNKGVIDKQIKPVGGHAMCLVGYEDDKFSLLNSWGSNWGNNGLALATSSFVKDAKDLWAIDV